MKAVMKAATPAILVVLFAPVASPMHAKPRALLRPPSAPLISRAPPAVALASYAGDVAGLFNNMKTPASILAGAILPIGFLAPLPEPERWRCGKLTLVKRLYNIVATASLVSELLSVMWATVAVNKLAETAVAPTASAWDLIQRDYNLAWAGCNAHFVIGMMGFMALIGTRAWLSAAGTPFGLAAAGMATSGLMLMTAIVNRGVAAGGGAAGQQYGGTVLALIWSYTRLLLRQATSVASFGPLELGAVAVAAGSVVIAATAAAREVRGRR